MTRLPIKP